MPRLTEYTTHQVASVLSAEYSGEDFSIARFGTDSRSIKSGDAFIALKGPNFDGHDHLDSAMVQGAVVAIVDRKLPVKLPQIVVKNTLAALGELASARRQSFNGKVIGLTGSNGKTTVKELIAAIFKQVGKVLATDGNFNNDIGLPLTLLRLENNEDYAVIEMGANHPVEIDYLSHITQPDIALITNAGAAHLEGFGDLQGVATAKAEIFNGLVEHGIAVINLDDVFAQYWRSLANDYTQNTFSLTDASATVFSENVIFTDNGAEFDLVVGSKKTHIQLPITGKHNVANALAAATVANALNISLAEIKSGLEAFLAVNGRLKFCRGKAGSIIIDDTYNANFDSTKAAIDVLSEQNGKRYFVIGDLLESGSGEAKIHSQIGDYASGKGITKLLAYGELTQNTVTSFGDDAEHYNEKQKISDFLKEKLSDNVVVLVKGSRGMKMEDVVNDLVEVC